MLQNEQDRKNNSPQSQERIEQEPRIEYVRPTLQHQGQWQQVTLGSIPFPPI